MVKKQKRIALINDLAGFGKCALTVSLPIISAMKIEGCVLPSAVLSTNGAFPGYFMEDYTNHMKPYIEHWRTIELEFDGIYCGFFASLEQVDIIIEFIKHFKKENTLVILDPIMGDNGKIYSITNPIMGSKLKEMLPYVDVLTPNLTECYQLLNLPYKDGVHDKNELEAIARKLSDMGPSKIVITGIEQDNIIQNFIYEKGKESVSISTQKIGQSRSGTGDVFASIVTGNLIHGEDFTISVDKAVRFLEKAIQYTNDLEVPAKNGICFEEFLTIL
jgi:pyridoxine kinase